MAISFKTAVQRAKKKYKSGRYKKFSDAVKAAFKEGGGATTTQRGKSKTSADKKRKARKPGKRVAKAGHKHHGKKVKTATVYYERRKNRSDKPGKVTGVSAKVRAKASLAKALLDYDLATTISATKEAAKRKTKYRKLYKSL